MEKTWNRWHTDGWVLTVLRSADGRFTYSAMHRDQTLAANLAASSLAEAQHKAEDIVRTSTHRCTGPCSYWVADAPDEG
jgi:Tfp pilus assembly protein PilX